jgi:glycosyltransferase involved in cell wall biosynthesis
VAPLRVLHIASGDAWGGVERMIALLVEGASGHAELEVRVLLLNNGELATRIRAVGASVHVIEEQGRSFMALCRDVRAFLKESAVDLIHTHRHKEVALALCATLPRIRPVVLTVHGLEPWWQMKAGQGLRVWMVLAFARMCGAWFVAVSAEIERRLRRRLGRWRIRQIGNALPRVGRACDEVNLRAKAGWRRSRPVVGFVGRLEEVKGPDLFLDLVPLCDDDVGFAVIGSGSMEADLRARVTLKSLGDRVVFLGQLPDVTPCLPQLDLLALTSRHEGLPLVLLEAAACEVPVVAFDVGGVREVLDGSRAARYVAFGDLAEFAREIKGLLQNRSASVEVARWANSVRSRFGLAQAIAAYLDVYRRAMRLH